MRERLFQELEAELDRPGPFADRLRNYATRMAMKLCSDPVVRAHRVIIAVTERMPELGQRFYERSGVRGIRRITWWGNRCLGWRRVWDRSGGGSIWINCGT